MYFWPTDKLDEGQCGIQSSFESAHVQAAIDQETELIVLECEISDEMLSDDCSCDNMQSIASYIMCSDFSTRMIRKIHRLHVSVYLAPFVLAGLNGNEYLNSGIFDEELEVIAKAIADSGTWIDRDEWYSEWTTEETSGEFAEFMERLMA